MIYVRITNELKKFEADIRDLCMAFFPYQKFSFIYDEKVGANRNVGASTAKFKNVGETHREPEKCRGEYCEPDVIIDDYFSGNLSGERLADKSELKRQLYDYLSKKTGKKLLWGTLTGIRPVTIVTGLIEQNKESNGNVGENSASPKSVRANYVSPCNDNELSLYLKKEYYISDVKANELIDIAKREIYILNRDEIRDYKNKYSIYIGVPFCKSTCLYCSFTSFNVDKFGEYVDKYLAALDIELKKRSAEIDNKFKDKTFGSDNADKLSPLTIYIGGGTPTSLNEKQFERLLSIIDRQVDIKSCIEYTVEAGRPDTITKEKLSIMKEYGVNRISINPQTFNQKTLDLIGRKHKTEDVIDKFLLARSLGFNNINMDIILGLPNEHLLEVINTLFSVYKLKPDSLTIHSLALKRAARLNYELDSWIKESYLAGVADINKTEGHRIIDKMYALSNICTQFLGLKPYYLYRQKNMAGNRENIGYSKEGYECIYNIMMMSERHSVYGFGCATSKEVFYENDGKRVENIEGYKSVVDYINYINNY